MQSSAVGLVAFVLSSYFPAAKTKTKLKRGLWWHIHQTRWSRWTIKKPTCEFSQIFCFDVEAHLVQKHYGAILYYGKIKFC
ncbi:hypothetical protein RB195_022373 [Necator americanus]|uniref:Secreted protein n=1 Tax=Necator americanus TaxID=51031 RepID=A0ABR1EF15_NECAM